MRGEKIDVFLCFTSAALSPSLSLSLPSAIPLQLHHLLCLTSAQGDGVHSRETNPRQLLSLPCSIHFLLFSSLCFFAVVTISSLSLSAAIHPSLPIFHFLFLFSWTHSDHLHYFSHPFGIRPVPARASNKSYSVFMCVARAPVCVGVCECVY